MSISFGWPRLFKSTDPAKSYETVRIPIPDFARDAITDVLEAADIARDCRDIMIWNDKVLSVRFVEVKCLHWDSPTSEQDVFFGAASNKGFEGKIAEWEFQE